MGSDGSRNAHPDATAISPRSRELLPCTCSPTPRSSATVPVLGEKCLKSPPVTHGHFVKTPGIPWEAEKQERRSESPLEGTGTEARSTHNDLCGQQAGAWLSGTLSLHRLPHPGRDPGRGGIPQGPSHHPSSVLQGHTRPCQNVRPVSCLLQGVAGGPGHWRDSTSPAHPLGGRCHRLGWQE